ncbi:MAG: hypothetical protein H0V92_04075, partial [Pseudonocardiales bacterium]|nr:hypothetical protein [Pseudonocardiales bacterium]
MRSRRWSFAPMLVTLVVAALVMQTGCSAPTVAAPPPPAPVTGSSVAGSAPADTGPGPAQRIADGAPAAGLVPSGLPP